ncbi:hypothetical protein [Phenylobacterium sp.]|uniref:hypothetical protein n=1 Tax=Phenylobacterium sp. TaxID=1871053 RepID=UPI002DF1B686|nr:hypothetical protein [Phenylobacterium sp.]
MAEEARAGLETHAPQGEAQPYEAPPSRLGIVLAALVAAAASASLAWWFAVPDRSADIAAVPAAAPAPPPAAAAQPVRYDAADPDANQVRRAWADVRQAYSTGGPEALVRASQACAGAVPAAPTTLDYCLAYDIYAAEVAPGDGSQGQAGWFSGSGDRGLALARSALPEGVDAHNRLAQVAALTTAVLPKAKPPQPRIQAVHARPPAARPHLLRARHVRHPVAPRPKLLKASVRHRPAPRPLFATQPPARPFTFRQAATLDDVLSQSPPGEPLDPPH